MRNAKITQRYTALREHLATPVCWLSYRRLFGFLEHPR